MPRTTTGGIRRTERDERRDISGAARIPAPVSTNISPDPTAGIGAYTEAEFARALREGVARDGHRLYPAMPYPSFARVNDEDMHALFVYFRNGVEPVAQKPPPTDLPWPFSMRGLMMGWNWIYLDRGVYQPDSTRSAEWNRGAYLVQGLGHCGDCHTPRSMLGGVKAASERKGELFLSGTVVDGWYAQPLRHTDRPSMAQWPAEDIVQYLQTGRTGHTAAFGAMVDVVQNSTQHLSTQDLQAVAAYLQSLGARPDAPAAPSQASLVAAAPKHPTAVALRNGTVEGNSGAMVYLNNCNACHRSDGTGAHRHARFRLAPDRCRCGQRAELRARQLGQSGRGRDGRAGGQGARFAQAGGDRHGEGEVSAVPGLVATRLDGVRSRSSNAVTAPLSARSAAGRLPAPPHAATDAQDPRRGVDATSARW